MIDTERLAELKEEVGAEDLAEVVALFCEEVEETPDQVRRHPTGNLGGELHFLRGSALNIVMSEVGQLCLAAEKSCRSDASNPPDLSPIMQALRKARQALCLELDT